MRRLCPKCQGMFATQFLCPNCGIQLLELSDKTTVRARADEASAVPVGMATRFIAGFLLAQGGYYGMRLLGLALFRLMDRPDGWSLAGPGGSMILLVTGLLGATLAGAGNPRGLAAGAAIGLFHTVALIAVELFLGHAPAKALMFGGWLAVVVLGALAGRYGRHMWPPLSDMHDPTPAPVAAAATVLAKAPREPIAWLRIAIGAAVAIAGTVLAGRLREYIIGTSGGLFTADSRIQMHFVTWAIAALAMAVGGGIAGAASRAGLRHGLFVAVPACVGVFLVQTRVILEALPAERFFAAVAGLDEDGAAAPARVGLFLAVNSLPVAVLGGMFGATLLPRTAKGPTRLDRGAI